MTPPDRPRKAEIAERPDAWALLKSNRAFRLLWVARLISVIGSALGATALLLYAAESAGQALAVAGLLIAGDFVPTLFSPLAGALSDRFDRRRIMLVCELLRGGITGLIALYNLPGPLFLALVGLSSVIGQVFGASSRSAVPGLVRPADLESANAALGLGTHGLDLAGPLLAAALLPFFSLQGLLWIDAATFWLAALLLAGLPALPVARPAGATGKSSFWREAGEGLSYIRHNRAIRVLTAGFFAIVAFNAVDDVALVFLAKDSLGATNSEASLLYAGAGAGLLIGFALLARYGARFSMMALLPAGYLLGCAGNLLTGLAWSIPAAFSMQLIRGLGISMIDLANNTLIQRRVPPHLLGRVFANVYGAIGLAAAISYLAGGFLINLAGPRLVLVLAGAGGLVSLLFFAILLPKVLR